MTNESTSISAEQLRTIIERIERVAEEKDARTADIRDIYAEAKGSGYNTKIIRSIVSLRKKDKIERQEEEAILELYKSALGMN